MLAVKSARVTRRLPKESHQKRKRHHSSLRSFIFHTVYDTFFSAVRVLLVLMESIEPIAEMNKEICHDDFYCCEVGQGNTQGSLPSTTQSRIDCLQRMASHLGIWLPALIFRKSTKTTLCLFKYLRMH